jgi:hypothetical protein
MSTRLYDEAIAEAKQLRELAEKNAKNAIMEAITPKIKSFIEDQLIGSESSNNDNTSGLTETLLGSALDSDEIELSENELSALMGLVSESSKKKELLNIINKVDNTSKEKNMSYNNRDEYLEIDLEDSLLSESRTQAKDVDEYSLEEIVSMLEGDDDGEDDDTGKEPDLGEMSLEALEEAILKMELDLGDDVELPEDWEGSVSVAEGEDELDSDDVVASEEGGEEGGEEGAEEAPADDAEGAAGEGDPLDDLLELDGNMITISESSLRNEVKELKIALKKESDEKLLKLNEAWKKKLQKSTNGDRTNRVLRGQLAEYRSATLSLRKQLTEMNLFNAKLLYVNKLLQNKGITTGQRRSIIESIDKAETLREVQLLFKSLTGSISKSKSLSESTMRKTLGSSSRVARPSSPRTIATKEVDRWATLAGLTEK